MTDDEVRTKSLTGGEKGMKPARYGLLPVGPLRDVARLYGRGAQKYEDRNWERGYEWSKSYDALQRHANAFWSGEDIDPEMELPHLAAVVFHALALMEWAETHPEFDDRVTTVAKRVAAGLSDTEEHDDNPCTTSLPCSSACEDRAKSVDIMYAGGLYVGMRVDVQSGYHPGEPVWVSGFRITGTYLDNGTRWFDCVKEGDPKHYVSAIAEYLRPTA